MERKGADAEAGSGHRSRCPGKLAVLVVVQNLLVLGCLLVTLHRNLFPTVQQQQQEDAVGIQVEDFQIHTGNSALTFHQVKRSYRMELDQERDRILVKCTGPYVWYMDVFYQSHESNGTLQLQAEGRDAPVRSIPLNCPLGACRGLYDIAYFRAGEKVSLRLVSSGRFVIRNVTMGLTYLLGIKCDY